MAAGGARGHRGREGSPPACGGVKGAATSVSSGLMARTRSAFLRFHRIGSVSPSMFHAARAAAGVTQTCSGTSLMFLVAQVCKAASSVGQSWAQGVGLRLQKRRGQRGKRARRKALLLQLPRLAGV
jgi:hypothetical protein